MEEATITMAVTALPLISGLLVAIKKWFNVSGKIKKIKKFLDKVDEALEDDKVTEAEFRQIYNEYRNVVNS